ncbi:trypsin-like peptidase domain-containing protein [Planktothrix sp. FACHB-1355]|uniref:Trypsin-like peptidase domain-containing protein n=2 Tax=Cyanophyceae TaxID=3028117 RepID=A0A926ZIT7_9CYAN|nr:trypsin-like peptidase domain-containing protein [Aerosakkonema funiforme FACHB-1375]MBD3558111.1 trypsin-like peptidase domain-containing protein [Planktothrix sp. FACHB-1355]
MNWRTLAWVVGIGSLAVALQVQTPDVSVSHRRIVPRLSPKQESTQLSVNQLYSLARLITVKVLLGDTWGSGILIRRQGSVYTVLTNQHVLTAGDSPYQIQTYDGRLYQANWIKSVNFEGRDLALLEFHSTDVEYKVASVGSSSTLSEGDEVVAAGFPFTIDRSKKIGFVFTTGQVFIVLDKDLNLGYQIGSTNDIQKGMSGGPLLNRWGEVVGINGMHKYPLWGDPYVFEDGSEPKPSLKKEMSNYSWAVPIETFIKLAPQFSQGYAARSNRHKDCQVYIVNNFLDVR